MRLPRGIFVKLVAIFLGIGLLPFLVIGLSTYQKAKAQMTETVIEYWLVRTARETAAQLDREVKEMRDIVRSWADDQFLADELKASSLPDATPGRSDRLYRFLDNRRKYRRDLDLLLLVAPGGAVVAESWSRADGSTGAERRLVGARVQDLLSDTTERNFILAALDPSEEALRQAQVPLSTRDWHVSPLVSRARGEALWSLEREGYPRSVNSYALGYAASVVDDASATAVGALVAIFNWSRIQGALDQTEARFRDDDDPLKAGTRYRSGYPFLFAGNLDTIVGHKYRENLGTSLTRDHGLSGFHERMCLASYGSFQYEYPKGTEKISGFARTSPPPEGFGWMVGVGINHEEIYADVAGLREFLLVSALIVTGLVILLAAIFSHRITEPVTRLIAYTEEVARGNLDSRVDIRTRDEIAVLADSFNKMAEDLKESNQRLIKAEKDAAWKEMARQVAHEIKNPLTPIMLSAQQLRKAHDDRHADFDEILKDSVDTIIGQCESLRRIASDFAAYAKWPQRTLRREDLAELVRGAVDLYRPRLKGDVEVACEIRTSPGAALVVDKEEIRRVFLNLFNNAMEAMDGRGGRLTVTVSESRMKSAPAARIEVADTGRGIPPESFRRLFEPYFSTRTGGTGLGLAICKRVVEDLDGTITVESELDRGTTFVITLPLAPPAAS